MARVNCSECWVSMQTCCGQWPTCKDCKAVATEQARERLAKEAEERRQKIESWEIPLVNIAQLDSQFCQCCGIPKNRCVCE